jgi:hypothetical protein
MTARLSKTEKLLDRAFGNRPRIGLTRLARHLNMTRATLVRMVAAGDLKAIRTDKQITVTRLMVEDFLRGGGNVNAGTAIPRGQRRRVYVGGSVIEKFRTPRGRAMAAAAARRKAARKS